MGALVGDEKGSPDGDCEILGAREGVEGKSFGIAASKHAEGGELKCLEGE